MSSRSADATIKGYYYQFDTTILNLLGLSKDTESVIVEGIEDIDVKTATGTTAVQCKYLSKPTFTNSAVREPITLMLDYFIKKGEPTDLKYILYAHFENETAGNEPTIDLVRIKEILTYKKEKITYHYEIENAISDATLNAFIGQFKLVFGIEFTQQQKQVVGLLKGTFSCSSDFEADAHFYNNALRIVIDLAINKDVLARKITKSVFLKAINSRDRLFNEWFIQLRTKKEYLKNAASNLKSTKALDPSKTKIILLSNQILSADNSELSLRSFVENLIAKYYKINSSLHTAKPITLLLDCGASALMAFKKELLACDIEFNDGREEIQFSPQLFDREPILNTTKGGVKISRSSYSIRVAARDTVVAHIHQIKPPKVLMNFSKEAIPATLTGGQVFDFKYCDNLKEVYQLL